MNVRKIKKEEMRLEKVGVPGNWSRFTIAGRTLRLSPTRILRLRNIVDVEMGNMEALMIGKSELVIVEAITDRKGDVDHVSIIIYEKRFEAFVLTAAFEASYDDFMEILNIDLRTTTTK